MKENRKAVIRRILFIFGATAMLGYGIYQLTCIYINYKKADNEYTDIKEKFVKEEDTKQIMKDDKIENPIDFSGLKSQNQDVIGWLMIKGFDISYPIMQSEDNEYYLNHTFERNRHFAGSIFMDSGNAPDFTDHNTILYGHNMKNGSMFGKLKKYRTQEVYDHEPYIWVYTPDKIYQYEVFACREVMINSSAYQIEFKEVKEFAAYVKEALGNSFLERKDIPIGKDDAIITLSTCTSNKNIRLIVQGIHVAVYE